MGFSENRHACINTNTHLREISLVFNQNYLGRISWEALGSEKRSVRKDEVWPYSSAQEGWLWKGPSRVKNQRTFLGMGEKEGQVTRGEKL